jgi:hypothetical protein
MLLRGKLFVAAGSFAVAAIAVAGCSTGAQLAAPGNPAAGVAVGGTQGEAGGGGQDAPASTSGEAAGGAATEIRSGLHGSEQRVVFDFSGVPEIDGLKPQRDWFDAEAPARGGSGEPVDGMQGKKFVHVVVQASGLGSATTDAVSFSLPNAKSAVVNDHEGGTAEMTVGVDADYIDYEVKVEGEKVIVSMYCAAESGCK